MSYLNVIMYSNVIPSYTSKKDDEKKTGNPNRRSLTPDELVNYLRNSKK
ncbi:hypothetical protein [Capnocytophaga sp.]|nr:hypothetical protein [Capnocytophaga sp.]MDO5106024.1 hypothetical protein [Capnocytophaga sp.]